MLFSTSRQLRCPGLCGGMLNPANNELLAIAITHEADMRTRSGAARCKLVLFSFHGALPWKEQ